jgi:hypothetical protein
MKTWYEDLPQRKQQHRCMHDGCLIDRCFTNYQILRGLSKLAPGSRKPPEILADPFMFNKKGTAWVGKKAALVG